MMHHESKKHHVDDNVAQFAIDCITGDIEKEKRKTGRKNAGELYYEAWERRRKNNACKTGVGDDCDSGIG